MRHGSSAAHEELQEDHLIQKTEWLVAGLQDAVRIYDSKTGSLVNTLSKSGFSVALWTAGLLAIASKSAVRVWRTSDWSEAFSVQDHMAPVAFSPLDPIPSRRSKTPFICGTFAAENLSASAKDMLRASGGLLSLPMAIGS